MINKKYRSANNPPQQGSPHLSRNGVIPVSGYENKLHITNDGIVQQNGGKIYYTNAAGEFSPVVMTDSYDVLQNVVRKLPVSQLTTVGSDSETIGGDGKDKDGNPIT